MNISVSVDLIWNIAAQETIVANYKEIEPEHIFIALLKFAELPLEKLNTIGIDTSAIMQLTKEVDAVRKILIEREIESTLVRRQVRARLGQGNHPFRGGPVHRSQVSRNMFDKAVRLAEEQAEETLSANHLLESFLSSSSPIMMEVMKYCPHVGMIQHAPSSLLAKHGKIIIHVDSQNAFSEKRFNAPSKALINSLTCGKFKVIFLISDQKSILHPVLKEALKLIALSNTYFHLKSKCFIDITQLKPENGKLTISLEEFKSILLEAAKKPEVILLIPSIEIHHNKVEEWAEVLKEMLFKENLCCVCQTTNEFYRKYVEKDPDWKRVSDVIWIHEASSDDVPLEL